MIITKQLLLFYLLLLFIECTFSHCSNQQSFVIDYERNQFLKDEKPFRYISAGMHYFRIPRFYWYDRLLKAKALGVNTIQTYIAWNRHEEIPGEYNFENENDVFYFISLAHLLDLLVILRPGPYIDAEWEFGGFPAWLANDTSLIMRTTEDPRYLLYVKRWFQVFLTRIKPFLYQNGGPVIAFQVENEYGNYYSCDKHYLKELQDIYQSILGDKVVLFTTDGYTDDYMKCGTLPSIFATIDFGTEITAEDAFKQQRKYQTNGPLVNSEYYTGWLDYWGKPHQTRDGVKIATYLDNILALNASVNLYMFIGGTNFGFMNGADVATSDDELLISPTSYDYDAPLSEAGDPTEKYHLLRNVIEKYSTTPLIPIPKATKKISYGKVFMTKAVDLNTFIKHMYPNGPEVYAPWPLTMENIGQSYGFLLYRSSILQKYQNQTINISIDAVHDRAIVYVDGLYRLTTQRGPVNFGIKSGKIISILVENQGRIAYGRKGIHYLPDSKGIIGHVRINNESMYGWEMFPLNDHVLSTHCFPDSLKKTTITNEMFFSATFSISELADTFVKMPGWTKGQIYINAYNIGRYWNTMGPQRTLFVPQNYLRKGENVVIILELDSPPCKGNDISRCIIEFVDKPIFY